MKKVELLAPAGGMEAFRGALNAGADAVYLAGQSFGARAYAQNFTEDELKDVLRQAHLFNVRIYLTVNILTRESELAGLVAFVSRMYEAGLDGVIVQDLGVASALRQACPKLLLHASTQMSVTGRGGVRFLQNLGFSRVVPARELSLSEIRLLKGTGIEVEAFIHGAMCYCYSGRCLMSSFLGGRSGNRGRCAGTCRLPYDVLDEDHQLIRDISEPVPRRAGAAERGLSDACSGRKSSRKRPFSPNRADDGIYPISMRDMCVLPILPELIDAGIDSFKIEGRMKKPEYAAGVTAVYRKYIDRFCEWDAEGRPGRWSVDPEDLSLLHQLYIRTDLSTGYYHERNGRDMITIGKPGYAGADPDRLAGIRREYIDANCTRRRKIPLNGAAAIRAGEPAVLSVGNAGGDHPFTGSLTGFGGIAQEAQSRPLTEETIREKIGKTGDSPFVFASIRAETDGHSFMPVSQLNALRREVLESLTEEMEAAYLRSADLHSADQAGNYPVDMGADCPGHGGIRPGNPGREEKRRALPYQPVRMECQTAEMGQGREGQSIYVCVRNLKQAEAALERKPDYLILDGDLRDDPEEAIALADRKGTPCLCALPFILRASDEAWLKGYAERYGDIFYGFITRNVEELEFLKEIEYSKRVIADSMLYVWNTQSVVVLDRAWGAEGKRENLFHILPLELDRRELRETFGHCLPEMILPVYGRVPLMMTANCLRKTEGRCLREQGKAAEDTSFLYLLDRTGAEFPVQTECLHCQNIIYNSVPTSLHRWREDPVYRGAGGILYSFTAETEAQVRTVLRGEIPAAFTNGHFNRGAL